MKKVILISILISFYSIIYSQEFATDKGSIIFSGSAGFTSQNIGKTTINTFALSPDFNFFVQKNFFLGAGMGIISQSYGSSTVTAINIGPQIGVAFGKPDIATIPFLMGGFRYATISEVNSSSGYSILGGGGLILAVKEHIGIKLDAGVVAQKYKYSDVWDITVSVGIGISGLLF